MSKKIISLVTLVVLTISIKSHAYVVPDKFLKRWTATPVKQLKENGKTKARAKVFRRYAFVGGKVYSVGTVTYFQFKKKKGEKIGTDNYMMLKKAFGEEAKWISRKVGNSMVIEGPWRKGNRYFRYVITENNESMSISTASFRLGYQDSVGPESLIIQREMVKTETLKKHFSFLNFISPISEAQAQFGDWLSGGGLDGLSDSEGNPLDISELTSAVNNLSGDFDQISTQLQQTNTQLSNANTNWGDTNQQLANSNQNWAETNRQYARTNDLMEQMLDPKHMFTLAAATSAGAVVGATIANLVIDGVVAGAKGIWELITDSKGKKERWEKFKKARKGWEKMNENVKKLEKVLDNFLLSQELMQEIEDSIDPKEKHKLSRDKLISHLSVSNRRIKKRQAQLEKIFNETTDMRCEEITAGKLDEVEGLVKSSAGLKKYLEKQNFEVYNQKIFCNELQNIMGKLGEAEAALQSYRINILNAREEWEDHNEERIEQMTDAIERINDLDSAEDFMEKRIANAKELLETVEDGMKTHKENWNDNCQKTHPQWKEATKWIDNDDWQEKSAQRKLKKSIKEGCKQRYKEQFSARNAERLAESKRAMEKKIELAKRDFQKTKEQPLEIDASVEDQRLLAYYKFFSDIEEQQYCYTHRNEPKCKQAGQVRFMGPFYIMDRAKVKLRNICGHDEYSY